MLSGTQPVDYVDASWTDTTPGHTDLATPDPGDTVTDGTVTATYGLNAFSTIQAGVNALASSGTTYVDAGTYSENVTIGTTGVSVIGPNPSYDPSASDIPANSPAIVQPAASSAFLVQATGVTIEGLTIQGSNSAGSIGVDVEDGGMASIASTAFLGNGTDLKIGSGSGVTSLTDNSLTGTQFIDNLASGSLDATSDTFNVGASQAAVAGSALTLAQAFAVEDRITDAIDESGLGFVSIQAGQVFVTPNSYVAPASDDTGAIARAIAVATAGDTINIANGTYYEANLTATQSLTIQGQSQTGVIIAPSIADDHTDEGDADPFAGTVVNDAFVIQSSGVTIEDLTVDGNANRALNTSSGQTENFRSGVVTDFRTGYEYDDTTVTDATFQNLNLLGVMLFDNDGSAIPPASYNLASVGNVVTYDTFTNVGDAAAADDGYAILMLQSSGKVSDNIITNTENGIGTNFVTPWPAYAPTINITGNQISGLSLPSGAVGIYAAGLTLGSTVDDNSIDTTGQSDTGESDYGIILSYLSDYVAGVEAPGGALQVQGNTIKSDGPDIGIAVQNRSFGVSSAFTPVALSSNTVEYLGATFNSASIGIQVTDFNGNTSDDSEASLDGDDITGFGIGVQVQNTAASGPDLTQATFTGTTNQITAGAGGIGIQVTGAGATATVAGATVSGGSIGVDIEDGGTASIDDNAFSGNGTDLKIGATSSVTSLTGNAFSGTQFIDNLASGNLDATSDTFNVGASNAAVAGSDLTLAEAFAVEDRITDAIDESGLGFVSIQAGQVFVTPNSYVAPATGDAGAVQRAVNAATAGDTVNVEAGAYTETLDINKQLSLLGAQAGVAAPTRSGAESVLQADANGDTPLIISTSDVTVDGFTIEGNTSVYNSGAGIYEKPGTSGTQLLDNIIQNNVAGLFMANSSATDHGVIENNLFQNNTQGGAAGGTDIYADQYTAGSVFQNVLIQDNTFTNTADVEDSWGIGISNTSNTPFSNIQVLDNQFSNAGRGMYFYASSDVTISGNNISGATHYAIGLFGNDGTPANSSFTITDNTLNGNNLGVAIEDGGDDTSPAVTGTSLSVADNLLENGTEGVYVSQYALDTATTTTLSINANTITGNDTGVELAGASATTSLTENFVTGNSVAGVLVDSGLTALGPVFVNSFSGNAIGIDNLSAVTLSALDDWWGSATGPTAATNPGGTGQPIDGPVNFAPFLSDGVDSDLATPGFQHALVAPTVGVTDVSGPYTGSGFAATASVNGGSSLEGVAPTLTYYSGSTASGSPLLAAPSTVGTYAVVASFAGSTDYTSASSSASFSITVATPSISLTDASGAFNGAGFAATATTAIAGVTPTLTYYSGTSVTGTALSGAPSLVGTYAVLASVAATPNYHSTSSSVAFSISQARPTLTVSDAGGIVSGSTAFPATDSIAGVNSPTGASLEGVTPTLKYFSGTNTTGVSLSGAPSTAGTYTALASFAGSADYLAASASATFTVNNPVPVIAPSDAGGSYTSYPFPATAAVTSPASLQGLSPVLHYFTGTSATGNNWSLTAPTAVGTYTVLASIAAGTNYNSASASTTFTITPAVPKIVVTDAGGVYDRLTFPATASVAGVGTQSAAVTTLEGVGLTLTYYSGTVATGSPLGAAPSLAGKYLAVASFAGSADYASATGSTALTINQATAAVTVSDPGGVYSGKTFAATALVAGASSLEGVAPTISYYSGSTTSSPLAAAPSSAGSYVVVANFPGSTDYASTSASVGLTISKAAATVTVSETAGSPYTVSDTVAGVGSQASPASSLEGVSPTLVYYTGASATGTPLGSQPTAAGTYTVVASFAGSTDYNTAHASTTFTVAKAAPVISVVDNGGVYNTQAFAATVTAIEGVTPTVSYYSGSTLLASPPSTVGSYRVVGSFAGSADYTSGTVTHSFSITQATPTVIATDAGGTYDAKAYAATASVAGAGSQSTPGSSLEGATLTLHYYTGTAGTGNNWSTTAPVATGTYTVVAVFPGTTDYATTTSSPVTFTIVPDPLIAITSGNNQSAGLNSAFAQQLAVTVTDAAGNPLSGALVTFTLPASGAGGTFAGGLTTVVVATNSAGLAEAPLIIANGTAGTFTVTASTPGESDGLPASFTLTNL